MNTLFDLSGTTALITGAAQGIGLAIARGLGQAGAALILNDKNQDALENSVATLAAGGLRVHECPFDVRMPPRFGGAFPPRRKRRARSISW